MIDDGRRIVFADDASGLLLDVLRHGPGTVNVIIGHIAQLWHPAPDVRALRVMFLSLGDGVEDAKVGRGVGTGARRPLPAAVVGSGITVDEVLHEVLLAPLPVDEQVLGEERGDDHAGAVVHPAAFSQLAHGCIDGGIARAPGFPRLELGLIVAPRDALVLLAEALFADARMMIEDHGVELAPDQLVEPGLRALAAAVLPGFPRGDHGLSRREHAEAKIR